MFTLFGKMSQYRLKFSREFAAATYQMFFLSLNPIFAATVDKLVVATTANTLLSTVKPDVDTTLQ